MGKFGPLENTNCEVSREEKQWANIRGWNITECKEIRLWKRKIEWREPGKMTEIRSLICLHMEGHERANKKSCNEVMVIETRLQQLSLENGSLLTKNN